MNINSKIISNPFGSIYAIREYGDHFRFKINWNDLSFDDRRNIKELYGADSDRLCVVLVVPVINNYLSLDKCKLHISEFDVNPSLNLIGEIDEYIRNNHCLPKSCGIDIALSAEEKVNLMSLL